MNNEQLKKLHKEKNTKAINENLYKANIKLVDMNRYLNIDIENLKQEIERLKEEYRITCEQKNNYISTLEGSLGIAEEKYLRLNNIINELEDILKRDIKACDNKFENMFDRNYRRLILEEKLEQLQELKGSDSNE